MFLDNVRDFGGQDDPKSVAADLPAQYVFGVRIGTAAVASSFGLAGARLAPVAIAAAAASPNRLVATRFAIERFSR
jgi:hypothetical protein